MHSKMLSQYVNVTHFYQNNYSDIMKMYEMVDDDCSLLRFVLFCYINRNKYNIVHNENSIIDIVPLCTYDDFIDYVLYDGKINIKTAILNKSYYNVLHDCEAHDCEAQDCEAHDSAVEIENVENHASILADTFRNMSDIITVDASTVRYLWEA